MHKPTWRLAGSLVTLRAQINQAWPGRAKHHDGTIGDAAHASRASDHNPNSHGVVCALDITHNPSSGCNCDRLAQALQASRDPRIKYLIWNGQIMSGEGSARAWAWRPYTGPNPHRTHLHVSVSGQVDDAREWSLPGKRELRLVVNGKSVAGAKVELGVSFAPVRALAEALGWDVEFDAATNTISVSGSAP